MRWAGFILTFYLAFGLYSTDDLVKHLPLFTEGVIQHLIFLQMLDLICFCSIVLARALDFSFLNTKTKYGVKLFEAYTCGCWQFLGCIAMACFLEREGGGGCDQSKVWQAPGKRTVGTKVNVPLVLPYSALSNTSHLGNLSLNITTMDFFPLNPNSSPLNTQTLKCSTPFIWSKGCYGLYSLLLRH